MQVTIRQPLPEDKEMFLSAMKNSVGLHHPWVRAPLTDDEFKQYTERYSLMWLRLPTHFKSKMSFLNGDLLEILLAD